MVDNIIITFLICSDILESFGHIDDRRCKVSLAEILTIVIIAGKYFSGNYQKSRSFFEAHGYTKGISKSRFIRRLNNVSPNVLETIFTVMAKCFKHSNKNKLYAIDSFPIPVCSSIRINKCKIYKQRKYVGFNAVKKGFFRGIKVHMLVTENGSPVKFIIRPGSESDIKVAKKFDLDLEKDSKIYADKAYNDYKLEDHLKKEKSIYFIPKRKKNSKRSNIGFCGKTRKIVETAFSLIIRNFPNKIHAITPKGFIIKVKMFIFAYMLKFVRLAT